MELNPILTSSAFSERVITLSTSETSLAGSSRGNGWTGDGVGAFSVVLVSVFAGPGVTVSVTTRSLGTRPGATVGGAAVTRPITGGRGWTAIDRAMALAKYAWSLREIEPFSFSWKPLRSSFITA